MCRSSKVLVQIRAVYSAELLGSGIGCCPVPMAEPTLHVINIHMINCASSLKRARMACHCTRGVWADEIC